MNEEILASERFTIETCHDYALTWDARDQNADLLVWGNTLNI